MYTCVDLQRLAAVLSHQSIFAHTLLISHDGQQDNLFSSVPPRRCVAVMLIGRVTGLMLWCLRLTQ